MPLKILSAVGMIFSASSSLRSWRSRLTVRSEMMTAALVPTAAAHSARFPNCTWRAIVRGATGKRWRRSAAPCRRW